MFSFYYLFIYLIGIIVGWFITFLYYQHKILNIYFYFIKHIDKIIKNIDKIKKEYNKNLEKAKSKR